MGVKITVAGADFAAARPDNSPIVTDGLRGWYWLGGSLDASLTNHAPGGVDAMLMGSGPAIMPTYAQSITASGAIDTGLVETAAMTLIAVARVPAWNFNNGAAFIASWTSASALGPELGADANGAYIAGSWTVGGVKTRRTANDQIGAPDGNGTEPERLRIVNWGCHAGRMDLTRSAYQRMDDSFSRLNVYADTTARQLTTNPTQTLRIGARADGARNLATDVAFAAIYDRYLSDAELDLVYRQVRGAAGRRGVVI